MIFAKVNVDLFTHPRLLRIPKPMRAEAAGVWLLTLLYSRAHELDGFCPLEAIDQVARDKVVDQLVAVGLMSRDVKDGVHGVSLLRYAAHNETKTDIDSRRYDTKRRVAQHRRNARSNALQPALQSDGVTRYSRVSNANVPDSDSVSGSLSPSGSPSLRINPPAQSFQDRKGEANSGTLVRADFFRREMGEEDLQKARAKALEDLASLESDPSFTPGGLNGAPKR